MEPGLERKVPLDVERTRLANERTFLAWWRTGLAATAAGFALGRLLPEAVPGAPTWPYALLGVLLAGAGITATIYGTLRYRAVARAIARGETPPSSQNALIVLTTVGTIAGLLALIFVAFTV